MFSILLKKTLLKKIKFDLIYIDFIKKLYKKLLIVWCQKNCNFKLSFMDLNYNLLTASQ